MSPFGSLSELLFPPRCIGCMELGPTICSNCRKFWHPHIYRSTFGEKSDQLKVYSSIKYSPIAQRVLLGSKENGLLAADLLLHQGIQNSLTYFFREIGTGVLVPIPSRASMARKRGRDVISDLVTSVIRTHPNNSKNLLSSNLLTHIRKVRDQSALNRSQRGQNLDGALKVIGTATSQSPIILVDDLVTSGATLLEASRAIRQAGLNVLGAVTACVSQPLR